MSHIFVFLFIIVSFIIKAVVEENEKKKKAQQQHDETEKHRMEELRRMIAEAQAQAQEEQYEPDEKEYYDEEEDEEEYDDKEQDYTPQYEPIPSAQEMPFPINVPKPAETFYQRKDMKPEYLANNLPDEGISAFDSNPNEISDAQQCNNTDQELSLSADDMRRAIIYQTILERPKF